MSLRSRDHEKEPQPGDADVRPILSDLYEANVISYEDARNADSPNDLRLQIKLNSQRASRQT